MPGGFDGGFDFGFGSPVLSDDDIGLFVRGHVVGEASVRLITVGSEQASSDFSLSILGHTVGQSDAALTIAGAGYASSGLDLFLRTVEAVSGRGDLFIAGETQPAFGRAPFWLHGADLPSGPSCPVLDPTASIQIGDDLIQIYQSRIDALINQLGKNVYLEFDPLREPCVNCVYDAVRKRSKGVYLPGGPRPFPRGRRCPYCKGAGFLETAVETCIRCLLKWNPADAVNFGMSVSDTKGIVRLKTYLDHAPGIMRANTALVHKDIAEVMTLRVKKVRGPYPVGLRQDRYCVSFWELVDG